MKTTTERLADAREHLARLTTQYEAAERAAKAHTFGGSDDPGVLSGIRRKPNRKADSARWASYTRAADLVIAVMNAEREVATLERRVRREAADAGTKAAITPDALKVARYVRDKFGWHEVVRVSAKSVTVATGYSWTERIALDDVIEVRP